MSRKFSTHSIAFAFPELRTLCGRWFRRPVHQGTFCFTLPAARTGDKARSNASFMYSPKSPA